MVFITGICILERVFGEEYRRYKERTPRYLGLPKKPEEV